MPDPTHNLGKKPLAPRAAPVLGGGSVPPKVSSVATEIPPATASENVDDLVAKINALRSTSGNTGFVPPSSSYNPSSGIPATSQPARMESRIETSSVSTPEFVPTYGKDGLAPSAAYSSLSNSSPPASSTASFATFSSAPSFPSPASMNASKVVQQLQSLSKEKVDSYEQLMQERPKTLMEEYGDTKIYRVQGEALLYYTVPVARPTVSERAIINTLKEAATRLISITPYKIRDPEQKRNVYAQQVLEILRASPELKVPPSKFDFYAQAVVSEMVGYGLIDALIKDDKLEEIMIIGPNVPVYVFHRKYDMMTTNVEFTNDNEIQDLVNRIAREVGRRVDISSPLLDARLPDGSRVNATIPPASVSGSTLTIRKFRSDPYSIIDLIHYKTVSLELAAFLWLCVDGLGTQPANILISGGTSSGKTTLLNVLCSFIPSNERVISIEDTSELSLPLRHWIRLEGRPPGLEGKGEITLDILTKNSLRMRPDRIIVGEVRHDEAFSLFTAMNTGHDGSAGTIHANSAIETLVRVTSPPMSVPEVMLSGLNFVIVENLFHSTQRGTFRRVMEVAEVYNVLEGKPKTSTVFEWDPVTDITTRTPNPVRYLDRLSQLTGKTHAEISAELKRRERFLQGLVDRNVRDMKTVSQLSREFLEGS